MKKQYLLPISLTILVIVLGILWFVVQKDTETAIIKPPQDTATTI